jgi:hypothetical protein
MVRWVGVLVVEMQVGAVGLPGVLVFFNGRVNETIYDSQMYTKIATAPGAKYLSFVL